MPADKAYEQLFDSSTAYPRQVRLRTCNEVSANLPRAVLVAHEGVGWDGMRRILHRGAGCLRSILDSLNRQFAKLFQLAAERFHLTAQMRVLKFDDFAQMLCIRELQREIEVRLGVLPGKRRDLFIQLLEVIRSWDRGCVDALDDFFAGGHEGVECLSRLLDAGLHDIADGIGKFGEIWCVRHWRSLWPGRR